MGPPTGMNLRNIVWHGFFAPEEFPRFYCSFLFCLSGTIGDLIRKKEMTIQTRKLYDFETIPFAKDLLKFMPKEHESIEFIEKTSFIPSYQISLWEDGIRSLYSGNLLRFLTQVLPSFEHCLRLLYSKENESPQSVLTADTDVFYCTLDNIMAEFTESSSPNKLISSLGTPIVEMIYDIFILPLGPRVRDRFSHGEVDTQTIPKELANWLWIVCLLSLHFDGLHNEENHVSFLTLSRSYRSQYHPLALCDSKLLSLFISFQSLNELISKMDNFKKT